MNSLPHSRKKTDTEGIDCNAFTICNDCIQLTVDSHGAQMMSIMSKGKEYLWQGDPRYWSDRAPVLFPFIARLTDNRYTYRGKSYPMNIHGFASSSEFKNIKNEKDALIFELCDNSLTRQQYPFSFSFKVCYTLKDNHIEISYKVKNYSSETMPYAVGGHPGFRIAAEDGEDIQDFRLEFSQKCRPDRVGFTPQVFVSGIDTEYPLESGQYLPLSHSLFDSDAIILKNAAKEVTLHSMKNGRSLTVSYPDFPFLGIWHRPKTDAPYVCIEPWSSLPSRQDIVEEFTSKSDMLNVAPGKELVNNWSITIN